MGEKENMRAEKNRKKAAAGIIGMLLFFLVLACTSKVKLVPLVSTDGQSYEKAKVTEIIGHRP